jgi:putative ABC transport system permease protein
MDWTPRIKFGGLLDFPDEKGETLVQAPVFGLGIDLMSQDSQEIERLNLKDGLVDGHLPKNSGEAVVSDVFLKELDRNLGDTATLISSTAYGGMAVYNFTIVGTVHFGVAAMDKNAMIADISGLRQALYMEDGASEILGFFPNLVYHENRAEEIVQEFNQQHKKPDDKFSPVMITLREQNGLGDYLDMGRQRISIVIGVFVFVMSIVLWNTGLMGGIRRYGEFGVRLAIGESKWHVYRTWIYETLAIGLAGSILGTAIGLGASYYLQEVGWDVSDMMNEFSMLMSNVMRAKITPFSYVIGFIPGFLATFIGSAISGIGIFQRQTAQLFKELEA